MSLRRQLDRLAAWWRAARTTFDVLRLLDREGQLAPASVPARASARSGFVARTGYVA